MFATYLADGVLKKARGNYTLVACVRCRTKKIKCDGQTPCANCQKKGVDCSKTEPSTNSAPISQELVNAATTVASAFFSFESQQRVAPPPFGVTAAIYGAAASAAAAAGTNLAAGDESPFSTSKRSCIPPSSSSSSANHGYGLSQPISLPDPISYLSAAALKDSLAAFNTICNPILPIISASELLSGRYMQSSRQKDPDAYAVWNGVVALGCFLSDGNKTLVDPIAATARDCLKDVFDSPSVDQSRALLLLGVHELCARRYAKARTYARMATIGSDTNPWFFHTIASVIRQFAMYGAIHEGISLAEDATLPLTFVPSEEALKYTTPDAPPLNWAKIADRLFEVTRFTMFSPFMLQCIACTYQPLPEEDRNFILGKLDEAEAMQNESNVGGPMACFFLSLIYSCRIDAYVFSGMLKEARYWAEKTVASWTPEDLEKMHRIPFYFDCIVRYSEIVSSHASRPDPQNEDVTALFDELATLFPISLAIGDVLKAQEENNNTPTPMMSVDSENYNNNEQKVSNDIASPAIVVETPFLNAPASLFTGDESDFHGNFNDEISKQYSEANSSEIAAPIPVIDFNEQQQQDNDLFSESDDFLLLKSP